MTIPSPILPRHEQAKAHLLPYGPADAQQGIQLVEFFDHLELEYAALHNNAVILDQPHRATIRATGADALSFLNNMLTQELKTLEPGQSVNTFWLNRKGRIDADMRVMRIDEQTYWFDLDAFAVERTLQTLGAFIITEEVELEDYTSQIHRLGLHGPRAAEALQALGASLPESNSNISTTIAGTQLTIDRHDTAGVPGFELSIPTAHALQVWDAFADLAPTAPTGDPDAGFADKPHCPVRPAGFHAWNMARIEAMTPVFNLDFATDSLPAETALLDSRVDFNKGCYLGQEVVARMHALGHPKRVVVPMQFELVPADPNHPEVGPLQPVTGSVLTPHTEPDAESPADVQPVGGVSSSTLSPAKGSVPVALATVKWGHHEPGTRLMAEVSGTHILGTVVDFKASQEA